MSKKPPPAAGAAAAQLIGTVKMYIPAGKAGPSPPLGPALGVRGVNIMGFCKEFNDKTKTIKPETPIPTVIEVYGNRTFKFHTKFPPNVYFLKQAARIEKGTAQPTRQYVGYLSLKHIYEIAVVKKQDPAFESFPIEGLCRA
eukprot:Colp12_sorted_trinity150504_noHs@25495